MPSPFTPIGAKIADAIQAFVPFLASYFPVTTEYGAPVAAGPTAGQPHYAVDFGTPKGTPLYSPGSGRVLQPNGNPEGVTGGNTLTVDYGKGVIITFAHLDKIFVKPGDSIAPGDFVATTGDSGIATGAHLHVDAWVNGVKTDVRELIDWSSAFSDYEEHEGATGGSFPIGGPFTGAVRGTGDALGDVAAGVLGFVNAILNPETWARVLAIIGGAVLAMVGFYMVWQSTASEA